MVHQPSVPQSDSAPVSPARWEAFSVLLEFEQEPHPPLDELIHAVLGSSRLSGPDRGLFFQLAQGVVRHCIFLDDVLDQLLRARSQTPIPARVALRMGALQCLFLDRVPDHAAVHETVELVRAVRQPEPICRMVNAILRRVAELDRAEVLALPWNAGPAAIRRRYSLPEWIASELQEAYGPRSLREQAKALAQPPSVCLRINTLKGDPTSIRARVEQELLDAKSAPSEEPGSAATDEPGGLLETGKFAPEAIRFAGGFDVSQLPAFKKGLIAVQDEAAQAVSHWVGARPGMRVVDFCAAPGGKTTHLAALLRNEGRILALDVNPWRMARIEEACARLGVTCVELAMNTEEVRRQIRENDGGMDVALVDPPCTNLGTLRRHPDVKWRHRATDPKTMAATQGEILEEAAACVRPGGVLVYSVCTFSRAETYEVVERFLARRPEWVRDADFPAPPFIPGEWRIHTGDWLTSPARDGVDGFYIARLRRPG